MEGISGFPFLLGGLDHWYELNIHTVIGTVIGTGIGTGVGTGIGAGIGTGRRSASQTPEHRSSPEDNLLSHLAPGGLAPGRLVKYSVYSFTSCVEYLVYAI